MLNPKLAKEIIVKLVKSTPGIVSTFSEKDIEIIVDKNINVKLSLKTTNSVINIVEVLKMLQKQIYFELEDKTDLKNYVIDISIKD